MTTLPTPTPGPHPLTTELIDCVRSLGLDQLSAERLAGLMTAAGYFAGDLGHFPAEVAVAYHYAEREPSDAELSALDDLDPAELIEWGDDDHEVDPVPTLELLADVDPEALNRSEFRTESWRRLDALRREQAAEADDEANPDPYGTDSDSTALTIAMAEARRAGEVAA